MPNLEWAGKAEAVAAAKGAAFASAHNWLCGGENGATVMYTFRKY